MGLFSSKKKHFVDSQVVRVIEDMHIPNPAAEATIRGVLLEEYSIFGSLMDRQINGPSRKFNSFYRYANIGYTHPETLEHDIYEYGLPNLILHSSSDGNELAKAQLETEVGSTVTVDYMYFRPLNNVHACLKKLMEEHNYNPDTNVLGDLTESVGYQCYIERMVAVHSTDVGVEPETTALGTMGDEVNTGLSPLLDLWDDPTSYAKLTVRSEVRVGKLEVESCEVHAIWKDHRGDVQRWLIVISLEEYDTNNEYYQAKYENETTGKTGYWVYDPDTGTNEELNNVFNMPDYIDPGTYYPFVVIISEYKNRADEKYHETTAYKSTVKLLDKLDMDFQEIADALFDEENEGIEDIEQAVMMLAVPITTENPVEIDYLYRWMQDLYGKLPNDAIGKDGVGAGFSTGPYGGYGGSENSWAMTFTDADFEMKVSFERLSFSIKAGNIGRGLDENGKVIPAKAGDVASATTAQLTTDAAIFTYDKYNLSAKGTTDSRDIPEGVHKGKQVFIQKQLNEHLYGEFILSDPKSRYVIYKKKSAKAGFDDERLLIPIDRDIARSMNAFDREVLLYRSFHFVFNSHVVQKIKWYQKGVFKVVLMIVMIVLIVINPQFIALWGAAVAGGAGAIVMFILTEIVLNMIIVGLVVQFALEELAKLVGPELAMLIAIVAALVGIGKGIASGSFTAGTAGKLLKAASGLVKAAGSAIAEEMKELTKDFADWTEDFESKSDELKELEDALHSGIDLNPYLFVAEEPLFIEGETSDEYFSRTLQGNPGVKSLDIIENYVSIYLMLPETNDLAGIE